MGDTENGSWSASELSGWIRREEARMDRRERDSLDRHITGNYGEDQFQGEEVLERLLSERSAAIGKAQEIESLKRIEAELDKDWPQWREYVE